MRKNNLIKYDLTGQTFGNWLVLERMEPKNGQQYWLCECQCAGKNKIERTRQEIRQTDLFIKKSNSSCGCIKIFAANRTHGLSGTKIYDVWHDMWRRCYDEKHVSYADYGGRGISVCEEWQDKTTGILNFVSWLEKEYPNMGDLLSQGYQIDREDNDGNYTPENCKLSTRSENCNNRRSNRNFELQESGETKTMTQIVADKKLNFQDFDLKLIHQRTTYSKQFKDSPIEEILKTPKKVYPEYFINGKMRTLANIAKDPILNPFGTNVKTLRGRINKKEEEGIEINEIVLKEILAIPAYKAKTYIINGKDLTLNQIALDPEINTRGIDNTTLCNWVEKQNIPLEEALYTHEKQRQRKTKKA